MGRIAPKGQDNSIEEEGRACMIFRWGSTVTMRSVINGRLKKLPNKRRISVELGSSCSVKHNFSFWPCNHFKFHLNPKTPFKSRRARFGNSPKSLSLSLFHSLSVSQLKHPCVSYLHLLSLISSVQTKLGCCLP